MKLEGLISQVIILILLITIILVQAKVKPLLMDMGFHLLTENVIKSVKK